ncbi:PAS domain S-box protein [Rhizobium herbae]|uniref:histidine kinase n=1 Tax=Rhizobium herbae TaxID=508661 RepID=A0ABS4EG71_9HYPH|nr:PAS domain S-box protein [Rhizobium herbae]MBP1856939.1 PAS domain S-box-containing protein [Rhizobium herbae]
MPIAQKHFIQALYDSFPDPVIIVDSDKIIRAANQSTLKQFGYSLSEIADRPARILYGSQQDYEACMNKGASRAPGEPVSDGIYLFARKDGSAFSARLRSTQVIGDDGTMLGFIGVVHDISDILALDRERKKTVDMLNAAVQAIPEGFAIFDKDEKLLVFNEAYRRILGAAGAGLHIGMTAEEILVAVYEAGNYPFIPVGSPDAKAWIESRIADFRNPSGKAQVFPYADGRWLQVENLKATDGNTVVLRIDVTELKEAERARDRQRLEYYTLVQNIPDFITRVSKDLTYIFVNERYAQFTGLTSDELIGRPLLDFVPERDRAPLSLVLANLSPDEPIVTREQRQQLADGSDFWIFWSNMAVFDGRKLVEYITVGRDITELKRQQARIAQQSAELQRKNEALNQFTGTVSHDLKAPLRHMSMFSEMIGEDVASGNLEELPLYAKHLRQSARRMDQLIDSLLDYAQIADQISHWQTVSMTDVISDAILNLDSFIREAEASIELSPLPQVRGDPELLKRLCQNLIGNAVKYRRDDVKPIIRIYAEKEEGSIRFYFQDNGIGIDPRFSKKIFDVFQRLHRDETVYQGTGIGLALAKRIAESHNGSIELDTTFTEGARFMLVFPDMRQSGGK